MTLPYPHEVETGKLPPRAPAPRTPFDPAQHLSEGVRAQDGSIELFGVPVAAPTPDGVEEGVQRFRAVLTEHFQKWQPNADADTWAIFTSKARALAERAERADDELLKALTMEVDGL
jgi:hypothetical protein